LWMACGLVAAKHLQYLEITAMRVILRMPLFYVQTPTIQIEGRSHQTSCVTHPICRHRPCFICRSIDSATAPRPDTAQDAQSCALDPINPPHIRRAERHAQTTSPPPISNNKRRQVTHQRGPRPTPAPPPQQPDCPWSVDWTSAIQAACPASCQQTIGARQRTLGIWLPAALWGGGRGCTHGHTRTHTHTHAKHTAWGSHTTPVWT